MKENCRSKRKASIMYSYIASLRGGPRQRRAFLHRTDAGKWSGRGEFSHRILLRSLLSLFSQLIQIAWAVRSRNPVTPVLVQNWRINRRWSWYHPALVYSHVIADFLEQSVNPFHHPRSSFPRSGQKRNFLDSFSIQLLSILSSAVFHASFLLWQWCGGHQG